MKIKLTEIEYADCGCPTCGAFGGDYNGTYEDPPDDVVLEVEAIDLNNPNYTQLGELAELPYEMTCDIEVLGQ